MSDVALFLGDCKEVLKRIEKESVDLTVTSPPYDNLRKYKGFVFDFEGVARELYRVTKQGGVVVWVVNDATVSGSETVTSAEQKIYFRKLGFNIHDTMIYAKTNYIPLTHNRYEQQFEYMFVFSKGKPKTFNPLLKKNKQAGKIKGGTFRQSKDEKGKRHKDVGVKDFSINPNIWFYNVGMMNSTKDICAFEHPAIFPENLAKDHILSWSNEGDTVLDPMMGSGTTGKMAKLLNRNFIGIDISQEYLELADRRIEEARLEYA